jgi:ribosomal protein S30
MNLLVGSRKLQQTRTGRVRQQRERAAPEHRGHGALPRTGIRACDTKYRLVNTFELTRGDEAIDLTIAECHPQLRAKQRRICAPRARAMRSSESPLSETVAELTSSGEERGKC